MYHKEILEKPARNHKKYLKKIDPYRDKLAICLAVSSIFLAGAAVAQNKTDATLQTEKSEKSKQKIEDLNDVITIYGTRQESNYLTVPQNIDVLTDDDLDDQMIGDMQQLVRYLPSVEVSRQTSGTDPFSTFGGFQIRGVSGNRVQISVDGGRIPERIIDGTRDYLDFNFTRQVDIVHGPGSVLWGADALGGIVALSTIDPEDILVGDQTYGGEADISFDSLDNTLNNSVTGAYQLNDKISFLAGLAYIKANEAEYGKAKANGGLWECPRNISAGATPCNELDPMRKNTYRGLAKAVITPDQDHRIEISADYMKRITDVEYNRILGPQYSAMTGNPTGEVIHDDDRSLDLYRARFALEHDWHVGTAFLDKMKWSFSFAPNAYDRTGTQTKVTSGGDNVIEKDILSYKEKFAELDVQLTSRFDTLGLNHTFTYGFDGDIAWTDYERIDRTYNLSTGVNTESRAGGFNFANATTKRADVYIQDKVSIADGLVEITPGVRYAYYQLDPRPNEDYKSTPGEEPVKVEKGKFIYSLAAQLNVTDEISVYGAFNQGFKMPTAQQLYTSLPGNFFSLLPAPDLRPETVNNYEIGFRGNFDKGFISLTGYHADYTDFIQSFYNIPGTNDYTYRNLSSVKMWGLEAAGAYQITDNLRANASVSWQRGRQKANPTSDTTDYTSPPLKTVMGLSYQIPEYDLTLDTVATVAGAVTRTDTDNRFKPDGYAFFDVFASWDIMDNAQLRFGVKNLFDKRYFQASAAGYNRTASDSVERTNPLELQTGPGRTFEASLKYRF